MFSRYRRRIPPEPGAHERGVLLLGILSLLFFVLAKILPLGGSHPLRMEMARASEIMARSIEALRGCREAIGLEWDISSDVNRTGLIGLEHSVLTTSIGNLKAKRTTTNPNFAGLLVYLMKEAGVEEGDAVAVGASGSFPALVVAGIAAAETLGIEPLVILSLGASQWGANHPIFHGLIILDCLLERGVIRTKPIAVSLGGDRDNGEDMPPEGRDILVRAVHQRGYPLVVESSLQRNVEARMRLYSEKAEGRKIAAFVNIGGNYANMGTSAEVLDVKPGLTRVGSLPAPEQRGVLQEMARRDVPVIHLLYVRGLVERYQLPWDPVPLPEPGEGELYSLVGSKQPGFLFVAGAYFFVFALFVLKNIIRRHS